MSQDLLLRRFGPILWMVILVVAETTAGPPNVLLMVTDDQRPDTIAALGNSIIKTPSLDELVRRGSTFTRATCANPICVLQSCGNPDRLQRHPQRRVRWRPQNR